MKNRNAPTTRPFFIIWTGQAISLLGSQGVQFALIWWVAAETGSAAFLATATLFGLLPQVALGPIIGALVDRWNRKKVMVVADATSAVASIALAALFVAGQVTVGHVLALLFVRAVATGFHAPAMEASTTLMVPRDQLTRIQGLNQALEGGMLVVSAPLGALLYALLPMAGVMLVDIVTAATAIGSLLAVAVPQPKRTDETAAPALRSEIVAGFRYVSERSGLVVLLLMGALINLSLVPAFSLLPLLVIELGEGATDFALLTSLFGIGTIAGGIVLGVWGGFRRKTRTTLAALIGLGIATMALAQAGSLASAIVAIVAVGIMMTLTNGPIQALLQATVAPDYQGRVFTLVTSLAGLTAPIGLALAAPIAEYFGVGTFYLVSGGVCVLTGIAGFAIPALEGLDDAEAAPGIEASSALGIGLDTR